MERLNRGMCFDRIRRTRRQSDEYAACNSSTVFEGRRSSRTVSTLDSEQRLIRFANRSSTTRTSLKTDSLSVDDRAPATEAEQTAIAAILSDMDAEIAALEAKLAKARQHQAGHDAGTAHREDSARMKSYYRVMLGRKSVARRRVLCGRLHRHRTSASTRTSAASSPKNGESSTDSSSPSSLPDHPDKSKIGAGLACGALWTVSKGIKKGDFVLCPDGSGPIASARCIGDYYYAAGQVLPHRRKVRWLEHSDRPLGHERGVAELDWLDRHREQHHRLPR